MPLAPKRLLEAPCPGEKPPNSWPKASLQTRYQLHYCLLTAHLDDFGDRERSFQRAFAEFRTRMFGPAVRPLRRLGVRADHLTLAGLMCLIPYAWWFGSRPILAITFLAASLVIDGLDGVYARATGTDSPGGAFMDVCADQIGMVLSILLLVHHGLVNAVLACYYAVIYVTMIALSVFQNYLGVPLQPMIRTKNALYGLVAVWAISGYREGFVWLLGIFSATMTVSVLHSFFLLKRRFNNEG